MQKSYYFADLNPITKNCWYELRKGLLPVISLNIKVASRNTTASIDFRWQKISWHIGSKKYQKFLVEVVLFLV